MIKASVVGPPLFEGWVYRFYINILLNDPQKLSHYGTRTRRLAILSSDGSYFLRNRLPYIPITKTRLFKYTENFTPKNWKFSDKKLCFVSYFAQNIDCGYSLEQPRWGSSNEYPQSMFLSRNKKNNVYPCKPQFYYIKVGFKGVKIIYACFRDAKDPDNQTLANSINQDQTPRFVAPDQGTIFDNHPAILDAFKH